MHTQNQHKRKSRKKCRDTLANTGETMEVQFKKILLQRYLCMVVKNSIIHYCGLFNNSGSFNKGVVRADNILVNSFFRILRPTIGTYQYILYVFQYL